MSAGDYVYRAIEEREAIESGNRLGPRFFATGEAFDGSRVYSITRPITSPEQIPLEMTRARELDFDYLKTYVRLDGERMTEIAEYAHEEFGVPTGSHSFSPGIFIGQDGTTHLSGTQRLGYARTESETIRTYDDVLELYGQGERSVHTTLFNSDFILADELTNDPRAVSSSEVPVLPVSVSSDPGSGSPSITIRLDHVLNRHCRQARKLS